MYLLDLQSPWKHAAFAGLGSTTWIFEQKLVTLYMFTKFIVHAKITKSY